MGSHEWADQSARTNLGPAPGHLRVLIGRSAAIVLILGALTWISVSLLFNPPPRAPGNTETIPLQVAQSPQVEAPGDPPGEESPSEESVEEPLPPVSGSPGTGDGSAPPAAGATAVVHMIGAVKDPGVYALPLGSRVLDAVARAGGLAKDAAPEAINLAAQIRDGEQIRIPRRGEAARAPDPDPGQAGGTGGTGPPGAAPGKLNVNTADQGALEELPGIGPALAGRILAFRQAHGPFKNLSELDAVSGIGPAMLGNLRDLVVFE
ncbi:ComEA family DNA-binding protein [Paeniglutamicibacter psychrophenolicus]|uniref:ComEA family DNA-binding protein n=1 Tax=Paeniglutamicibacter psychrophenolicus TaxID=257454 RepID=UPI002781EB38|nr:ComEA family DNA-binding protein [Paeniglutamicibacter psychrophenolicus]MDQ0093616.1 competence protein ComEA [Paeniglutamicibacter psychrophenolicus]